MSSNSRTIYCTKFQKNLQGVQILLNQTVRLNTKKKSKFQAGLISFSLQMKLLTKKAKKIVKHIFPTILKLSSQFFWDYSYKF